MQGDQTIWAFSQNFTSEFRTIRSGQWFGQNKNLWSHLTKERSDLERRLNDAKASPTVELLQSLSIDIAKLTKTLADATSSLPAYDQKLYETAGLSSYLNKHLWAHRFSVLLASQRPRKGSERTPDIIRSKTKVYFQAEGCGYSELNSSSRFHDTWCKYTTSFRSFFTKLVYFITFICLFNERFPGRPSSCIRTNHLGSRSLRPEPRTIRVIDSIGHLRHPFA